MKIDAIEAKLRNLALSYRAVAPKKLVKELDK